MFCFALYGLPIFAQQDSLQHVIPNRQNSLEQQQKPYVILVSADGFRYDYADKYDASFLKQMRTQGVEAAGMIPSFPSKTFPNHYTIVTGMYPATHGLLNNHFYDPVRRDNYTIRDRSKVEDGSWYGGVPLWVLAEQQQMLTASFFWAGSEAPILGTYPTYYYHYTEEIPFNERVETVVNWLQLPEARRPHLITFYLPEVDKAGHNYGPDSPQTAQAVQLIDAYMQQLTSAVAKTGLPVNFIFLSDHGMTAIDQENTLPLPAAIDTSKFIVSGDGMVVELHARDKSAVKPTYKNLKAEAEWYKVYRKHQLPRHLRYGRQFDASGRGGDIILLTEAPKVFNFSARKPAPGNHGFDPKEVKDMYATFYAWGPAFKKGTTIKPFKNIQVYGLVTELLGLPYAHKIDGNKKLAKKLLRQK